jgi:hypothetical protein
MSMLDRVQRGPTEEPARLLIYGTEKIGKTTILASIPACITVTAEDGGGDLNYERVVVQDWIEVRRTVRDLIEAPHPYRTLGLDSLSALEGMLTIWICEEANVSTIEAVGGGFGKGYTAAAEEWRDFLRDLDRLRERRRMAVVAVAHSHIRQATDPGAAAPYDRYELRLDKRAAALWTAWVDGLLFACIDAVVVTASANKRAKADPNAKGRVQGDGKRVICTVKSAAYDAGIRFSGIPEELPMSWKDLAAALRWDAREKGWRPDTALEPIRAAASAAKARGVAGSVIVETARRHGATVGRTGIEACPAGQTEALTAALSELTGTPSTDGAAGGAK